MPFTHFCNDSPCGMCQPREARAMRMLEAYEERTKYRGVPDGFIPAYQHDDGTCGCTDGCATKIRTLSSGIDWMKRENARLRELTPDVELHDKNRVLRREIARMQETAHTQNVKLDALHIVWCTGRCGGFHRYTQKHPLSLEMVEYVEQYAKRLRTRYNNNEGHNAKVG